jgi:fatty-acyl-CoA synthase
MPALRSLMQDDWPLVLPRIIDHAARWHGGRAVVTSGAGGAPAARHTYAEIRERAALCALMLRRLGVRPGDRVGTLATNSHRHLEAWYGIAGAGAVCHTLNPRLFERDLEYIINHAGDVVILADPAFLPLLAALAPRLRTVRAVVALAAEGAAAAGGAGGVPLPGGRAAPRRAVLCYEALLAAERPGLPSFAWHPCRETDAAGLCYTRSVGAFFI